MIESGSSQQGFRTDREALLARITAAFERPRSDRELDVPGTEDTGSIGNRASHGCIRMTVPDVKELYDRVPTGTPIYIA